MSKLLETAYWWTLSYFDPACTQDILHAYPHLLRPARSDAHHTRLHLCRQHTMKFPAGHHFARKLHVPQLPTVFIPAKGGPHNSLHVWSPLAAGEEESAESTQQTSEPKADREALRAALKKIWEGERNVLKNLSEAQVDKDLKQAKLSRIKTNQISWQML